ELEYSCPRIFHALIALAVFSIIGIAGLLRLEAQEQATESKPKESQSLAARESAPNSGDATEIRGRVLAPHGRPVPGAKIYREDVAHGNNGHSLLRRRRHQKAMVPALRATSDTDGHFGFAFSKAELLNIAREDFIGGAVRDVAGEVMAVAPGHGCGWAE